MRSNLEVNRKGRPRQLLFVDLSVSVAVMIVMAEGLCAQVTGPESKGTKNPAAVPAATPQELGIFTNLIHNPDGKVGESETLSPWSEWSFSLSTLYDFSNQQSRVGGIPLVSNSAGIDLTVTVVSRPYTVFDFIYAYSHGTGSLAGGADQTINQYLGEVRILQPIYRDEDHWKPAYESEKATNEQLAVILDSGYGGAIDSLTVPSLLSQHDTQHLFVQDSLLDGQIAIFPTRTDKPHDKDNYPNYIFELSSGVRFSRFWIDPSSASSAMTSRSRQLDYVNIASFTHSFTCGLGFLVAVEWDAPLDSGTVHNTKPYYANTATFSGGLVYNLYPAKHSDKWDCAEFWKRWSLSLLYSYTAFDPLTETNTLQLQLFYSF